MAINNICYCHLEETDSLESNDSGDENSNCISDLFTEPIFQVSKQQKITKKHSS